jgi:hypothetical protein
MRSRGPTDHSPRPNILNMYYVSGTERLCAREVIPSRISMFYRIAVLTLGRVVVERRRTFFTA